MRDLSHELGVADDAERDPTVAAVLSRARGESETDIKCYAVDVMT